MKNYKKLIYALVLVLIGFSIILSTNRRKELFRVAIEYNKDNLETDLFKNDFISSKLYEGLVRLGENGEVEAGVAESWNMNGNTWTFKLRKNVKLSNGNKIIAQDFVEAISRNLRIQEKEENKLLLYNIKGAKDYEDGISEHIAGLRAIDNYTLEFELNEKISYFPKLLSNEKFFLNDEDGKILNNGSFIVSNIDKEKINLEKSKTYWNKKNIKYDFIELINLKNQSEILERYEAKEINMIFLNNSNHNFFKEHRDFQIKSKKNFTYLAINNKSEILKNKNIRKAIAYGIDIEKIKRQLNLDISSDRGFIPSNFQQERFIIKSNLEKAKKYLNLGLNELNKDIKEIGFITVFVPNTSIGYKYKKLLEETFLEIGLKIRVESPSLLIRRQKINQGNYDIYIDTSNILYNSQIAYLESWFSKSREAKLVNFSNSEYDEIILEIRNDINKFQDFVKLGEELLMENMPVIPLFIEEEYFLSR